MFFVWVYVCGWVGGGCVKFVDFSIGSSQEGLIDDWPSDRRKTARLLLSSPSALRSRDKLPTGQRSSVPAATSNILDGSAIPTGTSSINMRFAHGLRNTYSAPICYTPQEPIAIWRPAEAFSAILLTTAIIRAIGDDRLWHRPRQRRSMERELALTTADQSVDSIIHQLGCKWNQEPRPPAPTARAQW